MKKRIVYLQLLTLLFGLQSVNVFSKTTVVQNQRWSQEKANSWYSTQPWLVGCNFQPSTAINQA